MTTEERLKFYEEAWIKLQVQLMTEFIEFPEDTKVTPEEKLIAQVHNTTIENCLDIIAGILEEAK